MSATGDNGSQLRELGEQIRDLVGGAGEIVTPAVQMGVDAQPWQTLPHEVATMLRPLLSDLAHEIIVTVGEIPAYSRPVEGDFGVMLHAGVRAALEHMVAEIEASGPVERSDIYRELGRYEMRAGRSLDSLLSAYRTGARVAWRSVAQAGQRAGLQPETLYRLAEAIFAYIDMLSAESAEGHARERSSQAGELDALRRQLVRDLVRTPPVAPARLANAAQNARWDLPRQLAVIAIAPPEVGADARVPRLPLGTIIETIGEVLCAVLPDPDAPRRREELERAVRSAGRRAAVGTTVAPEQAAVSFERARATLALEIDAPLCHASELSGELLLTRDPVLAAEFARQRLAPLESLSAGSRARLRQTLAVWLAEQGRLTAVAENLGIHPQTARYRLARLRELFGDSLEDPAERFWLELALRVEC